MTQTINLSNGDTLNFPDEMSDDQIQSAIHKEYGPPSMKEDFNPSFGEKLAPNILAGVAQMGHGLINAPHNIVNAFSPSMAANIPKQQDYDYAKMLKLPENATLADKLVRGLAQYSPAIAMPESLPGEALPWQMAGNAATQGAFGATQTENPVQGASAGVIGGAVGPLVSRVVNALRPSNIFRGNLSPEELKANQEATRGTETGLGRVLESPSLNSVHETWLPNIIGTGTENVMQRNANKIVQKGNDMLENIRGDSDPGDYGIRIQQALKNATKQAAKEKDQGYKILNDAADAAGVKVGRENFSKKAKDILDEVNSSPELKGETDPKLISDLERYAANKEGNKLKATNIFRSKIGEKANDAYTNGRTYEHGVYASLRDALGNANNESSDIGAAFNESNNPELKNLYAQNQKDFAEKYAPFEDKDIVKFTRRGGDPDLILSHFLRGGKNDRGHLLKKLTESLGTQEAQLPLHAYLSKSIEPDGKVNPTTLKSLYQNLGENQKSALIKDDSVKNQLDEYSNLVEKNGRALDLMFKPKTGYEGVSPLVKEIVLKAAQLVGGGTLGGVSGLLTPVAAGFTAGRGINKLLTSPTLRDKIIDAMLANKQWKVPGVSGGTVAAITPEQKPMTLELNKFKGYQE